MRKKGLVCVAFGCRTRSRPTSCSFPRLAKRWMKVRNWTRLGLGWPGPSIPGLELRPPSHRDSKGSDIRTISPCSVFLDGQIALNNHTRSVVVNDNDDDDDDEDDEDDDEEEEEEEEVDDDDDGNSNQVETVMVIDSVLV